jgi:hypothetical protein
MATSNKGLNQPELASPGWGTPLNDNASIIDKALGSFTTVNATNGTVNLTLSQCQNMCIKTGTDAFVADVTFVIPTGVAGQWVFINRSAANSFSLTVKNAAGPSVVSVASGQTKTVYSDGSSVTDLEISISTQEQAEAKTNNTTAMSPLRTAQQIISSLSSQEQAQIGADNTTLMTPLRTKEAVASFGGNINYQLFTASGTWTKPAGVPPWAITIIEMWGGGGGGGRGTGSGGGGGGGGYATDTFITSDLASTRPVVVGAGGSGRTSSAGDGGDGGNSSFNSRTAYGGDGGGNRSSSVSSPSAAPGGPGGGINATNGEWSGAQASSSDGTSRSPVLWGGGGGGGVSIVGQSAVYGGGGGGKGSELSGSRAGGSSVYGGAGGAGATSGTAGAGGVRGGGGGGGVDANGGSGGRGEVRVYTIW